MLMGMNLPKFHIYQGTGAKIVLRATQTFDFFQEKILSYLRPEIHLV